MPEGSQPDRHMTPLEATVAPIRPYLNLSTEAKIALTVIALLIAWGFAIATFGVPALVWPMKFIVPAAVLGLVLLTWGM